MWDGCKLWPDIGVPDRWRPGLVCARVFRFAGRAYLKTHKQDVKRMGPLLPLGAIKPPGLVL